MMMRSLAPVDDRLAATAAEARGRVERLEAEIRSQTVPLGSPRFLRAKEQLVAARHELEVARRALAIRNRDRSKLRETGLA